MEISVTMTVRLRIQPSVPQAQVSDASTCALVCALSSLQAVFCGRSVIIRVISCIDEFNNRQAPFRCDPEVVHPSGRRRVSFVVIHSPHLQTPRSFERYRSAYQIDLCACGVHAVTHPKAPEFPDTTDDIDTGKVDVRNRDVTPVTARTRHGSQTPLSSTIIIEDGLEHNHCSLPWNS